jgi:Leucine-rich repeat (LRR) protein
MEKSTSTLASEITALPEDKKLIDTFWKAYQEDFRAFKLYSRAKEDKMVENFKRLNPTSTINIQTIIDGVMTDANAENELKYDVDMKRALKWSQENQGIYRLIMKMGYTSKTTLNKPFLLEYYTQLKFKRRDITLISPLPFTNLKELDLSHNHISTFEAGLPRSLEVLVLYDNKISVIEPKILLPNLQYLNLGLNKISDRSLDRDNELNFS